jgi:predicted nucleic acid-binding Zn ribbon protein
MCQTPVTVGDRRCGDEACEKKFQESIRLKKRGMYMFIGLIVVVLIFTQIMNRYQG